MLTFISPAKINLSLRVGEIDDKGFHPLQSLVGFTDFGDRITIKKIRKNKDLTNVIMDFTGPFGKSLPNNENNFIVKAVMIFRDIVGSNFEIQVELEKNLPIASGLGGGTVNGGTMLRLLWFYWQTNWPDEINKINLTPLDIARKWGIRLGADGAMAIAQRGLWTEGYGNIIRPVDFEPAAIAIFHNGIECPTGSVFKRFDQINRHQRPFLGFPFLDTFESIIPKKAWLEWAKSNGNDLEDAAISLIPEIRYGIDSLSDQSGCHLARMSGSGAAIYGIFDTINEAKTACDKMLSKGHYHSHFVGMICS